MVNYRRIYTPGCTYFFTVVTQNRLKIFRSPYATRLLKDTIIKARYRYGFSIDALVVLPDHIHAIFTLGNKHANYSKIWHFIKYQYSIKAKQKKPWQNSFWEHQIQDDDDYAKHFDYIHYNPVKHGLVKRVRDYPYSTFKKYVKLGYYNENWGSVVNKTLSQWDYE